MVAVFEMPRVKRITGKVVTRIFRETLAAKQPEERRPQSESIVRRHNYVAEIFFAQQEKAEALNSKIQFNPKLYIPGIARAGDDTKRRVRLNVTRRK